MTRLHRTWMPQEVGVSPYNYNKEEGGTLTSRVNAVVKYGGDAKWSDGQQGVLKEEEEGKIDDIATFANVSQ